MSILDVTSNNSDLIELETIEKEVELLLAEISSRYISMWLLLASVKERELWKLRGAVNFVEYCESTWSIKKSHAYQMAKAGEIVKALKEVGIDNNTPLPTSIHQAVALSRVPEDLRIAAWQDYHLHGIALPNTKSKGNTPSVIEKRDDFSTIVENNKIHLPILEKRNEFPPVLENDKSYSTIIEERDDFSMVLENDKNHSLIIEKVDTLTTTVENNQLQNELIPILDKFGID